MLECIKCKALSHIVCNGLSEGTAKKTPCQCQSCVPPTAADFSGASVDLDANLITLQSKLAKYVLSFHSQILLLRDKLSSVKHTLDRAISRDISSIQDELNCVTQKIDSLQDLVNFPDISVNRPRTRISVNYPRSSRRSLRNPHPYHCEIRIPISLLGMLLLHTYESHHNMSLFSGDFKYAIESVT